MQYEVKTKQGTNFIVDDDSVELWLEIEELFNVTFKEAQELIARASLAMVTKVLFTGAKLGGHTELKTYKAWVKNEFDTFDVLEHENPKAETEHLDAI